MSKKFTWGELREFCNALPEEHLNRSVVVQLDCREQWEYVEPMLTEAMYMNTDDVDDVWPEEDFLSEKESGGIENPEDYEFYPAGRPFLVVLEELNGKGWKSDGNVVLPEGSEIPE